MKGLKPFFCYYGGKWRAAPHYPAPKYDRIIEPFAGAAGYSTRYPHKKVVLYEKDPNLLTLWDYLINVSESEVRALPLLGRDGLVSDLKCSAAARILIGFWTNKASSAPRNQFSSWGKAGTHSDSHWGEAIRDRVASQVSSIRHWSVREDYNNARDWFATFFVDPPYQKAGKHYQRPFTDFDGLGEFCKSLSGQVIVCEAEGANWLPFKPFRAIKAAAGTKREGISKEVIWLNDAE